MAMRDKSTETAVKTMYSPKAVIVRTSMKNPVIPKMTARIAVIVQIQQPRTTKLFSGKGGRKDSQAIHNMAEAAEKKQRRRCCTQGCGHKQCGLGSACEGRLAATGKGKVRTGLRELTATEGSESVVGFAINKQASGNTKKACSKGDKSKTGACSEFLVGVSAKGNDKQEEVCRPNLVQGEGEGGGSEGMLSRVTRGVRNQGNDVDVALGGIRVC